MVVRLDATDSLYSETAKDLRRYVRFRLKDIKRGQDIDVDDVMQETYLRAWSSRNATPIRNCKSYLFRIARNLIIDIGRRRRLQPFDNESGMPAAKGASYVTVVKLTPERFVGARQDLDVALSAINALPENCRRAFMLQRTTGMKYADVATALGMSESMVQKHMARALVELHKVLPD